MARKNTGLMIAVTAKGIPCFADVTHLSIVKAQGPRAASDWDCYGYSEVEFELYDRKGYRAEWLERKLSDKDFDAIDAQILKAAA